MSKSFGLICQMGAVLGMTRNNVVGQFHWMKSLEEEISHAKRVPILVE